MALDAKEREGFVLLTLDRWSTILEEDRALRILHLIAKMHMLEKHGMSDLDAANEIVSINCTALRKMADQLEELASTLYGALKK